MPSVLRTDALTTLDNLKDMVGIASSDTSKDNHLERCINRATWLIESLTNRKFNNGTQGGLKARKYNGGASTHGTTGVSDEDYIYFSGTTMEWGGDTVLDQMGFGLFYLPAFPVQANSVLTFTLASLNDRSSAVPGEDWNTTEYVEYDHYVVDRENGILRLLNGPFRTGHRNYRVTMAAGYQFGSAQPYVPPDLEACCIEMAKQLYRSDRDVISESIGTWSRSYSVTLKEKDPFIQQTISRYSRLVL